MLKIHKTWIERVMAAALWALTAVGMALWIRMGRAGRLWAVDARKRIMLRRLSGFCPRFGWLAPGWSLSLPVWAVRAPPGNLNPVMASV